MEENNPYSAPAADLQSGTGSPQNFELREPRATNIGQGVTWIGQGFNHFKQDPWIWIGICVIGAICMFFVFLLPLINFFAGLLTYVWVAGLMLGCKAQDDGEPLKIGHLFAGFSKNTGQLVLLGLFIGVISLVIMGVTMGSIFFELMSSGSGEPSPELIEKFSSDFTGMALSFLIAMALFIPLTMAIWFAPALIALNNVSFFPAMIMSFKGCLKNILPFLIYGLVISVIFTIAMIPIFLGLLIAMPIMFASTYSAYKDIFIYED